MLKIAGKVIQVGSIIERGEKRFKTADFVIETDEKYPQKIKFDLLGDKTDMLKHLSVGKKIDVHFNLKGKEYNEKFYNSLECYKFD